MSGQTTGESFGIIDEPSRDHIKLLEARIDVLDKRILDMQGVMTARDASLKRIKDEISANIIASQPSPRFHVFIDNNILLTIIFCASLMTFSFIGRR
jgi:hypothetical protein